MSAIRTVRSFTIHCPWPKSPRSSAPRTSRSNCDAGNASEMSHERFRHAFGTPSGRLGRRLAAWERSRHAGGTVAGTFSGHDAGHGAGTGRTSTAPSKRNPGHGDQPLILRFGQTRQFRLNRWEAPGHVWMSAASGLCPVSLSDCWMCSDFVTPKRETLAVVTVRGTLMARPRTALCVQLEACGPRRAQGEMAGIRGHKSVHVFPFEPATGLVPCQRRAKGVPGTFQAAEERADFRLPPPRSAPKRFRTRRAHL